MNKTLIQKKGTPLWETCLWWIARVFLAVAVFTAPTTPKKLMVLFALAVTFLGSVLGKFIKNLSSHFQTCVCLTAVLGSGLGFGFDLFQLLPEYDVPLSLFGGIIGVAIGYYISIALRKPETNKDFNFTAFISFCVSCALIVPKEIIQFFTDYFTGRNLLHCEMPEDDHWLFSLVGTGGSMPEQWYLIDFSEDITLGIIGSFIATAVLYIYIRLKNKGAFIKEKIQFKISFRDIPSRFKAKAIYEIAKVKQQTNIFDTLLWWSVRIVMLYAFLTMESRAEATLLGAILVGTFAISIIHFVFPKESMFCKINYRVQTLIVIIAFLGSYCGNYVGVYAYASRFDTLLHFVSGFIGAAAGYYIARTLVRPRSQKENLVISLFAMSFALAIIPIHEMTEFIGDYIWGTTNQGFMWEPGDNVLIYRLFGHGVGNELLIRIYDTMYDMSLASTTSILSFFIILITLERNRKNEKNSGQYNKTVTEKEKVTC
ncbi:MAG: hypothetical protein IJW86_10640 [Clostridia bacterium]|nr:hypothetical protein [Clostridia bacterium]MBQ7296627.1 hypothetical protein [Clostridia bacterium]